MDYQLRNKWHDFIGKGISKFSSDRLPTNKEVLQRYMHLKSYEKYFKDNAINQLVNEIKEVHEALGLKAAESRNIKTKFTRNTGLLHLYENARRNQNAKSKNSNRIRNIPSSTIKFIQDLENVYNCEAKVNPTAIRRSKEAKSLVERRLKEGERRSNDSYIYYSLDSDEE